jgi:MoaA/NifB/PqqE/SkfB family radical SAM enzyme
MQRIYPTATLRHLAKSHRLDIVVKRFKKPTSLTAGDLRQLLIEPSGLDRDLFSEETVASLMEEFLVESADHGLPSPGLPFAFVKAINFELTYGCNLACNHCLQDALRPSGAIQWMNSDFAMIALADGALLGLTQTGVNFTGGETYLPESPILKLIDYAAGLGINIRSNTNAWWGNRTNIRIGDSHFESDQSLVTALKSGGLSRLALSMDSRYEQYPQLLDRVVRVASLCEDSALSYEMVVTGAPVEIANEAMRRLHKTLGREPIHLMLTPMETVDIGAAAGDASIPLNSKRLANKTWDTPCQRKGFYRPVFLHVNPDGGVRSCLYAPSANVLGNINRERLHEILNKADRNPVWRLFADGNIEQFVTTRIEPWKHIYREIEHPCGASAMIARVAAAIHEHEAHWGRGASDLETAGIHYRIAAEMNLACENSLGEPSCHAN